MRPITTAMPSPGGIELPAFVLVSHKSTYAIDADVCIAKWIDASRMRLSRLNDDDTRAHVCRLVTEQVKTVMPLMFTNLIVEPTLAQADVDFGYASIRFIVQLMP